MGKGNSQKYSYTNSVRQSGMDAPERSGRNERPSILAGVSTPASVRKVGATSMFRIIWSSTLPAAMCPGAYASIGTRMDSS